MPLMLWCLEVCCKVPDGEITKRYYRNDVNDTAPQAGDRISIRGKSLSFQAIVEEVTPDPAGEMFDVLLKMYRRLEGAETEIPEEAGWSLVRPPHDLPTRQLLSAKQMQDSAESAALSEMSCTVALHWAAVIAMTKPNVTVKVFVDLAKDT
jgi:hypothetical protein